MKTNFLTQSSNLDFILNALLAISGCMPGAVFYVTLEPRGAAYAQDEQAFRVTRDIAELELDFIVETSGSSGSILIEDAQTGHAIWQRDVRESIIFTQPVGPLKKEGQYTLRFLGTASELTKITVSSQSGIIREIPHSSQPSEQPCLAQV